MRKALILLCSFLFITAAHAQTNSLDYTNLNIIDGKLYYNNKQIILFNDFTWNYVQSAETTSTDFSVLKNVPDATDAEKRQAVEMYKQGWRYTMPQPKSRQAAWGNRDGRTTWWYGGWVNEKLNRYSKTTPTKRENGLYLGDAQNNIGMWRNGGTPRDIDVYMLLLSE